MRSVRSSCIDLSPLEVSDSRKQNVRMVIQGCSINDAQRTTKNTNPVRVLMDIGLTIFALSQTRQLATTTTYRLSFSLM